MKATNSIFLLFAMFFSILNFAQKAKNYKGFYDDKAINIVLKSNSDGTLEGYLFYIKNSKSKFKISISQYAEFIDVSIYKSKTSNEKIASGSLRPYKNNYSGYLEDQFLKKHFIKILNFKNLALGFKQLEDISSVGSYEMLGNLDFNVEQNLAWKYLFDQNQYMKVEETFAHPVGWDKLNDKIAVLFFYQGKPTDTKYILSAITMKYTDDKVIDKLFILGTFSKDGSTDVCKLTIKSKGNFKPVI